MAGEIGESEHFRMIQANKQKLEQPQPQQQQPPQQPTNPGNGIAGIIESATKMLGDPATRALIVANPAMLIGIIDEYSEYKPLIYSFLQSSYPDIYEALSKVEPEQPEAQPEPEPQPEPDIIEKPVPREALNYEMMEMSREGYSATEIADYLSEKYDVDIYPMNVGRTIKRLQQAAQDKARATLGNIPKAPSQPTISKPAPIPAPIKFPDVDGMYSNMITTLKWSAVAVLTGILGFILGRLV